MSVNIEPATTRMATLVRSIPDAAFQNPTPCDIPLGDLLDHVRTLSLAFADAGRKEPSALTGTPPRPDAANLAPDWRDAIPAALDGLANAWRDPDAWTGSTVVGGMEMPGEAAGIVALDEVVIHGWDVARSSGQSYDVEPELLDALMGFLTHMAEPDMAPAREGLFGPVVDVVPDAPLLDRVVGLAGRDPAWAPSSSAP